MTTTLNYGDIFEEANWGTTFKAVHSSSNSGNVFICHASIADLKLIAQELTNRVTDKSWIIELDHRSKRAYEDTAIRTAKKLVEIFNGNLSTENKISREFGELMVSMGSAKALEIIFEHRCIPLAELWKPNKSQNEGFDFHTVCKDEIINFGEAKFSGSANPYAGKTGTTKGAGGQADSFIGLKKHQMDGVHLGALAGETAATNLDADLFGVVLGFSMNTSDPLEMLNKALTNIQTYENLKKATNIYLVGVSYDSTN